MDDARKSDKKPAGNPQDNELSFARQMFFGSVEDDEVFPFPDELSRDERETLASLLDPLDRFLRERVEVADQS